ncbi:unnamed protein product, partial [Brenthis ino]
MGGTNGPSQGQDRTRSSRKCCERTGLHLGVLPIRRQNNISSPPSHDTKPTNAYDRRTKRCPRGTGYKTPNFASANKCALNTPSNNRNIVDATSLSNTRKHVAITITTTIGKTRKAAPNESPLNSARRCASNESSLYGAHRCANNDSPPGSVLRYPAVTERNRHNASNSRREHNLQFRAARTGNHGYRLHLNQTSPPL